MKLPIATHTSDDILRAALRCRMDLTRILAEEFSADGLFAFSSAQWPGLPEANCLETDRPLAAGQVDRVTAEFSARNARCQRWTLPVEDAELVRRGATTRRLKVMRLMRWQQAAAADGMVLQARAAPAKVEPFLRQRLADHSGAVAARMRFIDDPQDEWLIALHAGKPIAAAALIISGEAGMLHDLHAADGANASLRYLIDRLIEYAGRAGLKHVLACAATNEVELFQAAGFGVAGELVEHLLTEVAR